MKLVLCFALSSLALLVTNGKKIKLEIDSQDLVNLFEGVMYSQVLKKIATDFYEQNQRSSKKHTLSNPYHPEDEFSFNTNIDKENDHIKDLSSSLKPEHVPESLEKLNNEFLNGNDVESNDVLTDIDMNPTHELIHIKQKNITSNSTVKQKEVNNSSTSFKKVAKMIFNSDLAGFTPVQKRFVLQGSNDNTGQQYPITPTQPTP